MTFIDIKNAKPKFDQDYLAELKDGSFALARLVSIQQSGATFKCISLDQPEEPWETNGVAKIAKLGSKPAKVMDPESLDNTAQ
jgi:hypothetical protein